MRSLAAAFRLAGLELLARRRRILALLITAALFLAAGATAAAIGREDGHVEFDRLFQVGGYPLISGMLLAGWLIGRFPMIAALVLMAGIIADDRDDSRARLLTVRPVHPALVYGARFVVLGLAAFLLAAILLPLYDLQAVGFLDAGLIAQDGLEHGRGQAAGVGEGHRHTMGPTRVERQ